MIKRRKILFIVLITFLISTITSLALENSKEIKVFFKDIKVSVNNKALKTNNEPFIYNNHIYMPLRTISEALGLKVSWDEKSSKVSIVDFEDIPESDPLSGERFIYGEIVNIDKENRTVHIFQHIDDNSIVEEDNLKISKDAAIILQRNNNKINIDFEDLKIGDIVGMIMNNNNEIRGIIIEI